MILTSEHHSQCPSPQSYVLISVVANAFRNRLMGVGETVPGMGIKWSGKTFQMIFELKRE